MDGTNNPQDQTALEDFCSRCGMALTVEGNCSGCDNLPENCTCPSAKDDK